MADAESCEKASSFPQSLKLLCVTMPSALMSVFLAVYWMTLVVALSVLCWHCLQPLSI